MAIHPSPRLAVLLLLSHLLAAVAVYAAIMSSPVKVAMFLLVLLSLGWHLARDALQLLPGSWCELSVRPEGVDVVRRDGVVLRGMVDGGSVASPYFVLLRIRQEGARWPVSRVIFPDALERDAFRDLCVRLRFG